MHCFNCQRTEHEVPLLTLHYQGKVWYICPQCIPTLIHKPHLLADKLPGAEDTSAA